MSTVYPRLDCEDDIKERLQEMDISLYEPATKQEEKMAEAMEVFSLFVLEDESNMCQSILESDSGPGGSVSELQGGSDDCSIYRVSIPVEHEHDKSNSNNAAVLLLREFHSSHLGKRYSNVITFSKLQQYMLAMCHKRSAQKGTNESYSEIDNLMFILQFKGGTDGQVRHIDNMLPNLQICLYISPECPSTIVYEMESVNTDDHDIDDHDINNALTLWRYWTKKEKRTVPKLIQHVLQQMGDEPLQGKWYSKYFSFWGTINYHLSTFGKLYQPVAYQHSLVTQPGTTLIAGGNEVHAGPPTGGPRMFVFGVGVPDIGRKEVSRNNIYTSNDNSTDINIDIHNQNHNDGEDNDGEVQYSPVLLHIDFCTLIFCILRHSRVLAKEDEEVHLEAKMFLLEILIELVKDYPMRGYLFQIGADRSALLSWFEELLNNLNEKELVDRLIDNAINSDEIFYTAEVIKKNCKQKNRRRKKKIQTV